MRIVITDSGLGGLSVCGALEERFKRGEVGQNLEIIYVNAAPEDDYGYNTMANRNEKVETFNRVLVETGKRYQPDVILIACNTLSVLYNLTEFSQTTSILVKGIVDTGVRMMESIAIENDKIPFIIFATNTTIDEKTYQTRLIEAGINNNIVGKGCPYLPDAISNDATGEKARNLLNLYCPDAISELIEKPKEVNVFLGCTHFGYQKKVFKSIIEKQGIGVHILNPNTKLLDEIPFDSTTISDGMHISVRFVSRYRVPKREIEALSKYLELNAPQTIKALRNHVVMPDYF